MAELQEIRRFGGVPQKNSGRGKHDKGDARWGKFIVDVKEYASSFGVSLKSWAKISTDAVKGGAEPALNIVLGEEGKPRVRLWVIGEENMQEYMELLAERDSKELRKVQGND